MPFPRSSNSSALTKLFWIPLPPLNSPKMTDSLTVKCGKNNFFKLSPVTYSEVFLFLKKLWRRFYCLRFE